MCLGSVWNTRFPFDLSASSIAVTMFFISTARAEANCSALIALGAWELTTGVEEVLGAKPGISLFLFLFRLLFCPSALFPAFEEAILISEATSNQISGFSLSHYAQVPPNVTLTCAAFSFSSLRFPLQWMLTFKFSILFSFLLIYGFLLLSCVGGNEMSVVGKATAKHTASVSCL